MKPLASEFRYLTNSLLSGIFLVPGFLWAATRLLDSYGESHARYLDLTSAHDKAAGQDLQSAQWHG